MVDFDFFVCLAKLAEHFSVELESWKPNYGSISKIVTCYMLVILLNTLIMKLKLFSSKSRHNLALKMSELIFTVSWLQGKITGSS